MFEFNYYNSAQPQIITSFKGNQKLILGGYRYNIHHVKEGVKTWRCVCAKKLTGARSWCKGRAETWEVDTKGIPKGEHNHQTEHDLAELEYFKSQLIFAAISDPSSDLNVLIDEATKFLSQGLSFGNRESMKKSLIVARKSAECGELKLGQQPHRAVKGVKRTSVRSKTTVPSSTLRSSAVNKNVSQLSQSSSRQKSVLSNRPSTEACSVSSPLSPNITSGNRSNNSSGIGSSLSTSDSCLDTSCFSSMSCNIQQNNWNHQNSHFELPSSSGTTFVEAEPASSLINNYGTVNVSMPGEQILAAALFAAAMLGSTQASQNQQQQHHFQETAANNQTFFIPSKKAAKGNNIISVSRNGTAPMQVINTMTNSFVKSIPTQSNNLKRKGARVNGILQKLSSKAAEGICTNNNGSFLSPALKNSMEIKKEMEDLSTFINNNTVVRKGEKETAPKRSLVNVQTQTDGMEMNGSSIKVENSCEKHNYEENEKTFFGLNHHESSSKRLICCCCFDLDETEGFNNDYFPVNCKKRAKLLLKREEYKSENNKSLQQSSPITNEVKQENKSDNNALAISEMELSELDNDLKLEIEEEEEEENEVLNLNNKCF